MSGNDLSVYDKNAEHWWDPKDKFFTLNYLNTPRFIFFDQHVHSWKGKAVLDVGCGGGFSAEFLAKRNAIVSGIDQSGQLIQEAKRHAQEQGFSIDYRQGFAEELPYLNDHFDVVLCVDVLEHVSSVKQTLAEIHRVLKPGGIFLFDTINRTLKSKFVMIWMFENWLKQIPKGVHDWNKFIKPNEMLAYLKEANFNDVTLKGLKVMGKDGNTGGLKAHLADDVSVMYIGTGQKTAKQ